MDGDQLYSEMISSVGTCQKVTVRSRCKRRFYEGLLQISVKADWHRVKFFCLLYDILSQWCTVDMFSRSSLAHWSCAVMREIPNIYICKKERKPKTFASNIFFPSIVEPNFTSIKCTQGHFCSNDLCKTRAVFHKIIWKRLFSEYTSLVLSLQEKPKGLTNVCKLILHLSVGNCNFGVHDPGKQVEMLESRYLLQRWLLQRWPDPGYASIHASAGIIFLCACMFYSAYHCVDEIPIFFLI